MFRTSAVQTLKRVHQTASQLHLKTTTSYASRSLVTSAQKRALNQDQIAGKDASKTTAKIETASTKPASSSGASPPPSGGDGGGGSPILPLVGLAAVSAGGAYYMDLIPMGGAAEEKKEEKEEQPVLEKIEEKKDVVKKVEVKKESKVEKTAVNQQEATKKDASVGNRVVTIHAPSTDGRTIAAPTPVQHDPKGSRVSVEKFSQIYGPSSTSEPSVEELKEKDSTPATPTPLAVTVVEAQKELTSVTSSKIDDALKQAHVTMRATLDDTFLKDLEKLNESQLRIRIVQLASEMGERTKWEAVRLREFLTMKEKEVADKFVELMQKQRLEFEDLLARRLREQEYQLTKQANDAIDARDKSIESVINAAADAQQAEHEAALKSTEERLERELNAKYESEFGHKLAETKAQFTTELEEKLDAIKKLTERLQTIEQNLEISRNFESGSQRAHRVSAAALALAEKMETSKGALEEYVALKSAAVENGVIASALDKVPNAVKAGIPTLSELQTSFEDSHKTARQAAYVPSGQSGVEGQFAGILFANLAVQPSPDALPPAESESGDIQEGKMADLILARAKKNVQLGELQEAVNELDKLKGQVSFTINDWKVAAMDRIAVDQALKVIKLECALMNKSMAG